MQRINDSTAFFLVRTFKASGHRLRSLYLEVGEVVLVARHDVRLPGDRPRLGRLLRLHRALLLHGQGRDEGGLRHVAGQGLGRQRRQDGGHRQGPRLRDQLPVEDVGQRALHTVVDGAPAWEGEIFIVNGAEDATGMHDIPDCS